MSYTGLSVVIEVTFSLKTIGKPVVDVAGTFVTVVVVLGLPVDCSIVVTFTVVSSTVVFGVVIVVCFVGFAVSVVGRTVAVVVFAVDGFIVVVVAELIVVVFVIDVEFFTLSSIGFDVDPVIDTVVALLSALCDAEEYDGVISTVECINCVIFPFSVVVAEILSETKKKLNNPKKKTLN